jgi:hypothetical protein
MEAQALVAAAAISLESCKREGRRAESLDRERDVAVAIESGVTLGFY